MMTTQEKISATYSTNKSYIGISYEMSKQQLLQRYEHRFNYVLFYYLKRSIHKDITFTSDSI